MKQKSQRLKITTRGPGFTDITREAAQFIAASGIADGVLTMFIPHTSASLVIQENADRDVLRDLEDAFARLAPRDGGYRHTTEGPDDMPSHIRAALTATSLSIPVEQTRMVLGKWQAIYVFEHRDGRHERDIVLNLTGE